jgi:hypothetical protein
MKKWRLIFMTCAGEVIGVLVVIMKSASSFFVLYAETMKFNVVSKDMSSGIFILGCW